MIAARDAADVFTSAAFKNWLSAGLSHRAAHSLAANGIETAEQLCTKSDRELLLLPNFGRASLAEVKGRFHLRAHVADPAAAMLNRIATALERIAATLERSPRTRRR